MLALLSLLTALLVARYERRHPGVASDPNVVGIFTVLAGIATAIGEAISGAAGAVGTALGITGEAAAGAAPAAVGGMSTIGGGAASVAPTATTALTGLSGAEAGASGAMSTAGGGLMSAAPTSAAPGAATGGVASGGSGGSSLANLTKLLQRKDVQSGLKGLMGGVGGDDKKEGGALAPPPSLQHPQLPTISLPGAGDLSQLAQLLAARRAGAQRYLYGRGGG